MSNQSGDLIYELIKDPCKITCIHSSIGIDKFIKIGSDNKLKEIYLLPFAEELAVAVYHVDWRILNA